MLVFSKKKTLKDQCVSNILFSSLFEGSRPVDRPKQGLTFNLCIKFHFRFFESTIEFLFNRLLQILVCLQFPDSNGESIATFLTIAFFIERLCWLILSRGVFRTPSNIYGAFLQKRFLAFNLVINICQIWQLTYFTNEVFYKAAKLRYTVKPLYSEHLLFLKKVTAMRTCPLYRVLDFFEEKIIIDTNLTVF